MKSKSNVLEYLAEAAKRRPGDTAVVDEFGSYTYKQLQDDSAAYGAALSEYDVANRGVVIMVEKCYDTLAIMLGTLFASGYYVQYNHIFRFELQFFQRTQCVGRFQCGNDSFKFGQFISGMDCFVIIDS